MSVKEISFKGIDGYETYAIDDKTIGIRPKWISVKDKTPELLPNSPYSQDVLAFCVSHGKSTEFGYPNTYPEGETYMCIDTFVKWNDNHNPSFRCDRYYGKVTHYMPLPKPPEE